MEDRILKSIELLRLWQKPDRMTPINFNELEEAVLLVCDAAANHIKPPETQKPHPFAKGDVLRVRDLDGPPFKVMHTCHDDDGVPMIFVAYFDDRKRLCSAHIQADEITMEKIK